MKKLQPIVKQRGYLTPDDLLALSNWKLRGDRAAHHIKKNEKYESGYIKDMTRLAFSAETELGSVSCLCCLDGVRLPTASAILHWFHPKKRNEDDYPIWDPRATCSVAYNESDYKNWFEAWEAYVLLTRKHARAYDIDMRTLDRALYMYNGGKEKT